MTNNNSRRIEIDLGKQTLTLINGSTREREYLVSTAYNGPGEILGSGCTPRGQHQIRALIGRGAEPNTVFVGRRPTGEKYNPDMRTRFPGRDWILTRILWLSGLEHGVNRLGNVDTMRRYIYIHGSPDDAKMGVPGSHGCIRMHNQDVIDLFNRVPRGTRVLITE